MTILEQEGFGIYNDQAWQLLYQADGEFVPPLSWRSSTTQTLLDGADISALNPEGPREYFTVLQGQRNLLALDGNRLLGFLSYIHGKTIDVGDTPVTADYISTIVIDPACRNQGICRQLYLHLFETVTLPLMTRTWSLNHAHIHLLESLGFRLAMQLADDRGPGIDTVYYIKGDTGCEK